MNEPPAENINLTLLLGAGASVPANYPTTEEFLQLYEQEIQPHQQQSFSVFKNIDTIQTIDDFIRELRDVKPENSEGQAIPLFIEKMGNSQGYKDGLIHDIRSSFEKFRGDCEDMYDLAIELIYEYYAWNDHLESGYNELKTYIELLENFNESNLPIFTTNYDVAVESMRTFDYDVNSLFKPHIYSDREVWEGRSAFESGDKTINLFKLHGSVDWNYVDGRLVKSGTSHRYHSAPDQDERELIAPGLEMGSRRLEDPYGTYFEYFESYLSKTDVLLIVGHALNDAEILDYINEASPNVIIVNPEFNTSNEPSVDKVTIFEDPMESDDAMNRIIDEIVKISSGTNKE